MWIYIWKASLNSHKKKYLFSINKIWYSPLQNIFITITRIIIYAFGINCNSFQQIESLMENLIMCVAILVVENRTFCMWSIKSFSMVVIRKSAICWFHFVKEILKVQYLGLFILISYLQRLFFHLSAYKLTSSEYLLHLRNIYIVTNSRWGELIDIIT